MIDLESCMGQLHRSTGEVIFGVDTDATNSSVLDIYSLDGPKPELGTFQLTS